MSHNPGVNASRELIKRDSLMWWRPGRIYIPAWQFSGLDYEITTATDIKSMGTGAANDTAIAEINTSGVTGLTMGANANSVEHFMAVPYDMDLSRPIHFSAVWTANNTSGSVTWAVLYKAFVANSTVLGSAPAATALSSAIPLDPMAGVAFTVMVTDEGRIYGGTLADNVEYLQIGVVRSAAVTITSAIFLGLNIRYTPRRLMYDPMTLEAKAPTYIASSKYAT